MTSTRALDHLDCAAGLACVKNGFAFTKQMDVWFALGWPHFVTLVHGLPEVADPVDAGNRYIGHTMSAVPAEIANGSGRVHQRVSGTSDWSSKDKRSVMNK